MCCSPIRATDFAPIVEAYARAGETGLDFPAPHTIVHETVAVGMAGRLLAGVGPDGRRYGACECRQRQRADGPHQRPARQCADLQWPAGRTPVTEKGPQGRARPRHPLGPGHVRPGRDAARGGEVGLRAASRRPTGGRGGARARRRRPTAAPGAGLFHHAATRSWRRRCRASASRRSRARSRCLRACRTRPAVAAGASALSAAKRPLVVANRGAGWHVLADFAERRFAMPVVEFWASRASLPERPSHAWRLRSRPVARGRGRRAGAGRDGALDARRAGYSARLQGGAGGRRPTVLRRADARLPRRCRHCRGPGVRA